MASAFAFYGELGEPFTEADMPPPPTHCTACGRPLVRREEQTGYTSDGRPDIFPTWRCPQTLGFMRRALLIHTGHDEYEPDKFGDPYWRRRSYM